MRIARTFCFSNLGQALYLTSPTEIQRITYSQETCDNLQVRRGPCVRVLMVHIFSKGLKLRDGTGGLP